MFKKPITVIKLRRNQYLLIIRLANRVTVSLASNLNFLTPNPALVAVLAAIANLQTAITAWGPPGNRGSHADLVNLRACSTTLYNMLSSLAGYVQTTAQTLAGSDYMLMATIISSSGFGMKNVPTPQGLLQPVENFRQLLTRTLAPNKAKLKWNQPLGVTSNNNVKSYSVRMSTTADFSTAVQIADITQNTFTDTNSTGGAVVRFYWIVALGAAGAGAPSSPIVVNLAAV